MSEKEGREWRNPRFLKTRAEASVTLNLGTVDLSSGIQVLRLSSALLHSAWGGEGEALTRSAMRAQGLTK